MAFPAYAQLPGTEIHANIPFDFVVRGKTLPAGRYDIRRINDQPDGLIIENARNRKEHTMFNTESIGGTRSPSHGELIFHRYGETYFLAQIWSGQDYDGRQLPPSHEERNLRREVAGRVVTPENVAVAAF
jgi:hypothetical protein